jgi:hypothetical protein
MTLEHALIVDVSLFGEVLLRVVHQPAVADSG